MNHVRITMASKATMAGVISIEVKETIAKEQPMLMKFMTNLTYFAGFVIPKSIPGVPNL